MREEGAILIAGAGIGGLALGAALRRRGVPFRILERAPELRELAVGIRRTALHRLLVEAVGRENILCDAELVGYAQRAGRVLVQLASGEELAARALVGADGIHSAVRTQLHPALVPEYVGYLCWRGIAPMVPEEFQDGLAVEMYGAGTRAGVLRISEASTYWWVTTNAPPGSTDAYEDSRLRLTDLLRGWSAPIRELVKATPNGELRRDDLYQLPAFCPRGAGRVTLMGDAWHAMTPNLGQGACQALEDARVLAGALSSGEEVEEALRGYEASRRSRASAVAHGSFWVGYFGQLANPVTVAVRNLTTRLEHLPLRLFMRWILRGAL